MYIATTSVLKIGRKRMQYYIERDAAHYPNIIYDLFTFSFCHASSSLVVVIAALLFEEVSLLYWQSERRKLLTRVLC
mgnify:CR=1 FL=1